MRFRLNSVSAMTNKNIIVINPVTDSKVKAKGAYSKNGEKRNSINMPAGINVEEYNKVNTGIGISNESEDHI